MNRYLKIGDLILELPFLLGITVLVLFSFMVILFFLHDFIRDKPGSTRFLLPLFGGIVLLTAIIGFYQLQDSLRLGHFVSPMTFDDRGQPYPSSEEQGPTINRRYLISEILEKPGFIRGVYDDGQSTFFLLNSFEIPTVYVGNGDGELLDQKGSIETVSVPGRVFPVLKVEGLSIAWYLQFNTLIGHIKQVPEFKVRFEERVVLVHYSDSLHSTIDILKDQFICDQASPQHRKSSIPHARYYFLYEEVHYYVSDCFIDETEDYKVEVVFPEM